MSEAAAWRKGDIFDATLESVKSGTGPELQQACESIILGWREVPVVRLLALKRQLERLGLEERESMLEEALISVAEKKRPPFLEVASDPANPLWGQAVEVLSMLGDQAVLEMLLALEGRCGEKERPVLVRAMGNFTGPLAEQALLRFLRSDNEHVFIEALMALRKGGGTAVLEQLRAAASYRKGRGGRSSDILDAVIRELEG